MLLNQLSSSHSNNMVGHTALRLGSESCDPPTFPTWCRGVFCPGLFPSNDTVNSESTVGIKTGDSGVMNGYQVDNFTCTWSAEQFVACSHIYPGFTGKVLSLTHFPLEPGSEDYCFLDPSCCRL